MNHEDMYTGAAFTKPTGEQFDGLQLRVDELRAQWIKRAEEGIDTSETEQFSKMLRMLFEAGEESGGWATIEHLIHDLFVALELRSADLPEYRWPAGAREASQQAYDWVREHLDTMHEGEGEGEGERDRNVKLFVFDGTTGEQVGGDTIPKPDDSEGAEGQGEQGTLFDLLDSIKATIMAGASKSDGPCSCPLCVTDRNAGLTEEQIEVKRKAQNDIADGDDQVARARVMAEMDEAMAAHTDKPADKPVSEDEPEDEPAESDAAAAAAAASES